MSWIQNFFTSRDNNTTGNTYVGQEGRLFYNPDTNALYVSDGTTVGGIPVSFTGSGNGVPGGPDTSVQYNAGGGDFGGDAFFTVDSANVTVQIGSITLTSSDITGVVANTSLAIGVQEPGNGVVQLLGPVSVYSDSNIANVATFQVATDGQVKMLVPTPDSTIGAVEIVGSSTGVSVDPGNFGGMLHITGQDNVPTRVYNDGINNYPLYVGRRYNGTASSPTGILNNQVVSRIGSNPYLTDTAAFTPLGFAKIDFVATQDQTTTAQGSRVDIYTTPTNSNVQVLGASFTADRIALTGNLIPTADNVYSLGNIDTRWIGGYFGNAGVYLEDTTLGTTGSMSLDNGTMLFDSNIVRLQVGNMWLTNDGIQHSPSSITDDILIGTTAGGNTYIRNAGIKFNDLTVQSTAAIPLAEKGAALGVVPLNASTKIDTIYLPAGGPVYKGTWNASTNTPTLVDGTGTGGDLYIVSVAGSQDLGSGSISFVVGDEVTYNGLIWQKIPAAGVGVASFNTRTGAVTLTSSDVTTALDAGSIVNAKLLNPSITVIGGTGISTTSNVINLGDTITLTNSGVTGVTAGTGVAIDSSTGNVTVSIGQAVGTADSVQFNAVTSTTTIQATGNITGGNISTAGQIIVDGNIVSMGYFITGNTLINSEISTAGNVTGANLITGGGVTATGNVTGGNLVGQNLTATRVTFVGPSKGITDDAEFTYNSTTNLLSVGNISTAGNITSGNVSVVGNIIGGNISVTGNITGGLNNLANIVFANTAPLSTAYPGLMEYDGRVLYFTGQDQERGIVPNSQWYVLNADRSLTYATQTPQSMFGVGVHVSNSGRYWFRIKAIVSRSAGTNNTAFTLGWRGSATMSKISYTVQSTIGAPSTLIASNMYATTLVSNFTNQVTVTGVANAPDSADVVIIGIIEVGAAGEGTVDPFISWTGAAAAGAVSVAALSNFQIEPLGVTGANTQVGNWS